MWDELPLHKLYGKKTVMIYSLLPNTTVFDKRFPASKKAKLL